jgi:hypothetical protein
VGAQWITDHTLVLLSALRSGCAAVTSSFKYPCRRMFEELFSNRIRQLLHNFPLDRLTATGTPFW